MTFLARLMHGRTHRNIVLLQWAPVFDAQNNHLHISV